MQDVLFGAITEKRMAERGKIADLVFRWPAMVGFSVSLSLLGGCAEIGYYGQAVRGQLEVMHRSRPIEEVLTEGSNSLTPEVSEALAGVAEILCFAKEELGLSAGRSYRDYADLGRPYVVWNVFAADEFELEPRTWWYPVVGRLSYRGYFSQEAAKSYATSLELRGCDVVVAGVRAYSTLGWLGDPVLNTFIALERPILVALICHELAHGRLFFPGDTAMSEAFATVVEEEALERWIARQGLAGERLRELQKKQQVNDLIGREFEAARKELAVVYGSRDTMDDADIRANKAEIFQALEKRCAALVRGISFAAARRFVEIPFNNARLAIDDSYRRLVPCLREILEVECDGDLGQFYREMEGIARGRRARLECCADPRVQRRRSTLKKSRMTLR